MSGASLTDAELMPLFEAARWAPSAYNDQPWRFIYAHKGTPLWEVFLALVVPANQIWVKNAAVLVVLVSKVMSEYTQNISETYTLDAGAAWMNFALQGSNNGLVVHAIGGFDRQGMVQQLGVKSNAFKVEVMIAVGKPGDKAHLPNELQLREYPNGRKPLSEIVSQKADICSMD